MDNSKEIFLKQNKEALIDALIGCLEASKLNDEEIEYLHEELTTLQKRSSLVVSDLVRKREMLRDLLKRIFDWDMMN